MQRHELQQAPKYGKPRSSILIICLRKWCANLLLIPDLYLQNEVESLRLRAGDYEFIVAQHGSFTLIVKQLAQLYMGAAEGAEEEGESEEKKEN